MINYIKESHKRSQNRKEYSIFNVPVYVLNPFPNNINLNNILDSVKQKLNKHMFSNVESIYIGDFEDLNRRNIQSMLKDDAIWISSNNVLNFITEPLVVENIIHEIAHSLEDKYQQAIYSDGKLEKEYEGKKSRLYSMLKQEGYKITPSLFFSDEYLKEFDHFLYNVLGYDKLAMHIVGLFTSPYSVTTLREYFANGFLDYILGDVEYLKDTNPILFSKIEKVQQEIKNEI